MTTLSKLLLQQTLLPQPVFAVLRPVSAWPGLLDAKAVSASGVDVHFRVEFRSLECEVELDAMLNIADLVVGGVNKEQWRSVRGCFHGWREAALHFEVAGIRHDAEIRSATDFVDIVDGVVGSFLEVGGCRTHQMSASGEANHADSLGVKSPFLCLAAHEAHRTLCIFERTGGRHVLFVTGSAWATILQNDPRHADGVEPRGHILAFEVPSQIVVSAAGANDRRSAGVLVFRGLVNGQRGFGDIGDPLDVRRAFDIGELLRADFARVFIRWLSRPDVHNVRLVGSECGYGRTKQKRKCSDETLHCWLSEGVDLPHISSVTPPSPIPSAFLCSN